VRVIGNRVTITAPQGARRHGCREHVRQRLRGGVLTNSVISGNTVRASSKTGTTQIEGVGLANNGPLEL
jgi:hypothetical protein